MTDAASPSDQRHEIETDAHQEEQILELKRISLGIVQEEFEQSTNTRHALDRAKRRIQVTLRDTVLQHQERFVSNSDLIRWVDETDL